MPFNSQTTRMPNGVTNAAPWQTLANAGFPDPTFAHQDVDDFNTYAAGNFTATVVGTGTQALTPFNGGGLLITNTAGAADAVYMQRPVASFQLTPGKEVFFKFAGQLSDVTNSVFFCGLIATSATPLTAADGLYLLKATAQSALSLVSVIGGVTTSVALPAVEVLVNATYFELGIHVDYLGNVEAFFNPTTGPNPISAANAASGASRGRVAALYAPSLTQVLLNPSFGLLNSTAAARTLTVDYFVAAAQR